VSEAADRERDARDEQSLHLLSPREAQVLAMVSRGMTNGEIAERLAVTVHAVKFHLASIYRKLGVGNRTEAAFLYLRSATSPVGDRPDPSSGTAMGAT
jgi:DNA-binding CsgD family transcriptional regulator